jgi:predicted regulator of Ras-like GTPase activity (Roadblock/LC7/MglB family)
MTRAAASPMEINKLSEARDLDACLGYLSLVNGIDGAAVYSYEGLVVAAGADSSQSLFIEAPYFVANFVEALRQCRELGLGALDHQVSFTDTKFHEVISLGGNGVFHLVVSGTRGSYELFKFRIERGAQAVSQLLHERGYLRG